MAQRDYASRKNVKKKKKGKTAGRTLLLAIAAMVVIAFAGGLYLLKEKAPEPAVSQQAPAAAEKAAPKTTLPSRLEERWNYIKELETREIPVDDSQSSIDKNARLSDEQKRILLQMEKDRKEAELAKQKQAEQAKAAGANPYADSAAQNSLTGDAQTLPKPAEQKKAAVVEAVKAEPKKAEERAVEKPKETPKTKEPTVAAARETAKTSKNEPAKETGTASSGGRFGLQCGAFKNKAQAEALQAKLTMAGFNARVNTSTDWNRVVIGPAGDRQAAAAIQNNAKGIANCVVIGM